MGQYQHSATHFNTLQHTATHCNALQHMQRTGKASESWLTCKDEYSYTDGKYMADGSVNVYMTIVRIYIGLTHSYE